MQVVRKVERVARLAKGTYAILLRLECPQVLNVGKLGEFQFPAGYYVYIGSALGGIRQRIHRHLRRGKALRWHVDYLREVAEIDEAWVAIGLDRLECEWAAIVGGLPEARFVALGFGSSDCRCRSHLVHFVEKPVLSALQAENVL